jgi:hypothetical protein
LRTPPLRLGVASSCTSARPPSPPLVALGGWETSTARLLPVEVAAMYWRLALDRRSSAPPPQLGLLCSRGQVRLRPRRPSFFAGSHLPRSVRASSVHSSTSPPFYFTGVPAPCSSLPPLMMIGSRTLLRASLHSARCSLGDGLDPRAAARKAAWRRLYLQRERPQCLRPKPRRFPMMWWSSSLGMSPLRRCSSLLPSLLGMTWMTQMLRSASTPGCSGRPCQASSTISGCLSALPCCWSPPSVVSPVPPARAARPLRRCRAVVHVLHSPRTLGSPSRKHKLERSCSRSGDPFSHLLLLPKLLTTTSMISFEGCFASHCRLPRVKQCGSCSRQPAVG